MSTSAADLLSQVLRLPEEERAAIAERLLDTLPAESDQPEDAAFIAELDARLAEFLRDPKAAIPWSELKQQE